MDITLKSIELENFKGVKYFFSEFSKESNVCGANGTGKTSIQDAFCWLLFDKDSSGKTSFEVRPLDSDNNPINDVVISVTAILNIDGTDTSIQKKQSVKWKKDATTGTKVVSGSSNEFLVDGFPKKSSEFKSFVSSICDETLFRMVTDPLVFPNLPWKQQRNTLEGLVSNVTDISIAESDPKYYPLMDLLIKGYSAQDILERDSKAKRQFEQDLHGIVSRKSELSMQISNSESVDIDSMRADKLSIQERINVLNEKKLSVGDGASKRRKLNADISGIEYKISMLRMDLKRKYDDELFKLDERIRESEKNISDSNEYISQRERLISGHKDEVKRLNNLRDALIVEYRELKEKEFDDTALFCDKCGQALPQDKVDELRDRFERIKSADIEANIARGKEIRDRIMQLETDNDSLCGEIEKANNAKSYHTKELEARENDKIEYLHKGQVTTTEEIAELEKKLDELKALASKPIDDNSDEIRAIDVEIDNAFDSISMIDSKIAVYEESKKVSERLKELEDQRVSMLTLISQYDAEIALLKNLISDKLNMISSTVNSKFKLVNWKLFDVQYNGSVNECCSCTINGVTFDALNSASKINAGLDIINTLSEVFGLNAPIFIDNRESVTEIIPMKSQVINLIVSPNDKTLKVFNN